MRNRAILLLTVCVVFVGVSAALAERIVIKPSATLNSRSGKPVVPIKEKGPLGKVFELTVNLANREYVDLDTATVFPYPRNMRTDTETMTPWEEKNGIDAHFGGNKKIVKIYERSMISAPVSDDKWNCTEEELMLEVKKAQWIGQSHSAKAVGNSAYLELHGKEVGSTFVFKTQQGNVGVLQIKKVTQRGRERTKVEIRYWLLKNPTVKIADEQIIWGKEVNGIVCGIKPVKKSFYSDDNFEYDILYKNVSDRPITVCTYTDRYYVWTQLKILNTEGRIVARGMHANGTSPALKLSDFVTLKPGETASVRQKMRARSVKRLAASSSNEPGKFAAKISISGINRIERYIRGFDDMCKKYNMAPWIGVIESGPSPFTVMPPWKEAQALEALKSRSEEGN